MILSPYCRNLRRGWDNWCHRILIGKCEKIFAYSLIGVFVLFSTFYFKLSYIQQLTFNFESYKVRMPYSPLRKTPGTLFHKMLGNQALSHLLKTCLNFWSETHCGFQNHASHEWYLYDPSSFSKIEKAIYNWDFCSKQFCT